MTHTERQAHGFLFQDWIVGRFLDMAYSAEWDIPKKINPISRKSVSIKTAQWKSSVGLGDALKQFGINEDFEMVVAFYKSENDKKKIIHMTLLSVPKEKWKRLWGNMTDKNLKELDGFIKKGEYRNIGGNRLEYFRNEVQRRKKELLSGYTGRISLNPKIDSKKQRRLQCSIPFKVLFEEFGLNKGFMKEAELWEEKVNLNDIRI